MRYPDEPHTLVGGVLVHQGAISMVEHLRASGHRVELVDGSVNIEPEPLELDETAQYMLDAFSEDIAILLGAGNPTIN